MNSLAHGLEQPFRPKIIDTHAHVVFGVDDGASSLEMSLKMLEVETEQGVREIICTSHSWGDMRSYKEHLHQLQEAANQRELSIHLHPGCEIACMEEYIPGIIARLRDGSISPMGNSAYMLLEFHPWTASEEILHCVQRILELTRAEKLKCRRIVIAHVERYQNLSRNEAALQKLLDLGCLLQINAYSLVKESDPSIKSFARRLLAEKKVSFLGSDAHRIDHRPPDMETGVRYVYDHCDLKYANAVCYENAKRLLTGALG